VVRAEGTARRADGTSFPVGYSQSALNNLDGTLIGTLVLFQDLSEIVALRETAARGDRLAVLGRLSAGLAHEIRNPLSSISGSVQLVRQSEHLDGEDKNLLGIVVREVERLDDLVSTMLMVGRPREPQRKPCDLRRIVDDVVEIARRGPAADGGITIEHLAELTPVVAWADEDQIRQVLWNLVKNALQASPRGSAVRVLAHQRATHAVLEVSDQGRGIDPGQRSKIYDMFYSERTHGAGIGLALVRQIVDAHQGSIEIISEQSRGAIFVVSLPARSPLPLAADAQHASLEAALTGARGQSTLH
jgi:two-component system sensor histidine kinase PilS (NtrC family)